MKSNRRTTLARISLALALVTAASSARADLPPPDGVRFVDYAFSVQGLAAHPDWVLLAFPWSLSNGAPTEEIGEVNDGAALGVGRRSGTPKLYAMKRADYEAFKKAHTQPSERYGDPALKALFAGSQAIACDLGPSPEFQLGDDDPRESIVENFRLISITAGACDLERGDSKTPAAPASAGASPASGERPSAAEDAARSVTPSREAGCAGCSSSASDTRPALVFALLGAFAFLLRRRIAS